METITKILLIFLGAWIMLLVIGVFVQAHQEYISTSCIREATGV